MQQNHVFVSYVRENSELVDKLHAALSVFDVAVWLDRQSILPGTRWQDAIRSAIQEGAFFLACFSRDYLARDRAYMNEELVLAIDELRKRPADRAWFIPVLLTPCEVPDRSIGGGETLRAIQHVSLYENWDAGVQRILSVVKPDSAKVYELIAQLRERAARARVSAADQLGALGGIAAPAIPALVEALGDEHVTVRGVAAESLGKIGVVSEEVVVGMLRMKDDDTSYGWEHAQESFKRFGGDAVPMLIKFLDSDRGRATLALREIGPAARDAVPHLIERVDDRRGFEAQALGRIGDVRALPALLTAYEKVRDDANFLEYYELEGAIAVLGEPNTKTRTNGDVREVAGKVLARWIAANRPSA